MLSSWVGVVVTDITSGRASLSMTQEAKYHTWPGCATEGRGVPELTHGSERVAPGQDYIRGLGFGFGFGLEFQRARVRPVWLARLARLAI